MSTNIKENLGAKEFDLIYRHSLKVGDIGICKWNMDKEELYIDIDNFKTINNNFGFQFGNLVIKEFARLLSSLLGESCELAKFPGDKFMIILYGFKDMKEVEELCDKIYDFFEKPMEILDNQIYINLSAGVAFFPHDSSDVNELIKFCDFAVSQSKALGKNVVPFSTSK